MNDDKYLKEESIWKLLVKYSVPAILTMMMTSLYNTVDRAYIGSIKDVGALAISGLGVTMPLFTILGAFCVGIAVGGATNISIRLGEDNKEKAEATLKNMFLLQVVVGVLMTILGTIFLNNILYAFGASNDTILYAKDYMSVIIYGAWFNLPGYALNTAIRGSGNPKLSANMMIVSCILNIILDPLFIFVFNMGIRGAAIATVISQFVVFAWSLYYFTKGKSTLKLKLDSIKIDSKILKSILAISLTPFFMEMATGFIHLITNRVLKSYGGDLAIGAMTTVVSIVLLFLMPLFGLSQGMQTIVAYNYGAKEYGRAKKTLANAFIVATVILVIGYILISFFPQMFISIFTRDTTLTELSLKGISIYCVTLPLIAIPILGTVYFQSIGRAKVSMVLGLLRQVIILIPVVLIIPKFYGLNGVWAAQPIADILTTIIVVIFLVGQSFKNRNK